MNCYKKIIQFSNYFYNEGLEKAKVRDLTGAIECLCKSLRFFKGNIKARNLLGLVYFGHYQPFISKNILQAMTKLN